jgi:HNH endonuclease
MTTLERLLGRCEPEPNSGCWLYLGGRNSDGYGSFYLNGQTVKTHRFAWEEMRGPIPSGLWVLHKCDVRHCCNPDHLYLGTIAENTADWVRRGRVPSQRGELNRRARLTGAQVVEMRALLAQGVNQQILAAQFGVSDSHVSEIKRGRKWAHV